MGRARHKPLAAGIGAAVDPGAVPSQSPPGSVKQ
jgi:hypothetical protein